MRRHRARSSILSTCGFLAAAALWAGCAGTGDRQASSSAPVDYVEQIQPILETNCYECHGSAVQVPSGKLRLDGRKGMLKGGRSGHPTLIPGNAADSPLYIVITGGSGDGTWRAMPPHGKRLNPDDIALIRGWIDQGATFGAQ